MASYHALLLPGSPAEALGPSMLLTVGPNAHLQRQVRQPPGGGLFTGRTSPVSDFTHTEWPSGCNKLNSIDCGEQIRRDLQAAANLYFSVAIMYIAYLLN